jgi:hypothetical protein
MTYPTSESLIQSFGATHRIIRLQTNGLTHADSLLQLPFRGNCLNWVLGHIVVGRDRVLRALGAPPVFSASETARYETGSEPISRDEQALSLDKLLTDLDTSQQRTEEALKQTSPETLAKVVDAGRGERPLGEYLAGLHWHETYHTGQLEILRQLAGKNDAVI